MMRSIVAFATDVDGDWMARLDCGHNQHVRHNPPFTERPWVTSKEGRAGMLGQQLDCVRCDAFEFPDAASAYKRTDEFTDDSIPAALRRDHTTKAGVWAKIVVLEGRLRYRVDATGTDVILTHGGDPGIVVPELPHHVEPLGRVRFFVEFYRVDDASG